MTGGYPSGLARRTVLITGGASGIGAETARLFSAAGASVIVLDRDAEALARLRDKSPQLRTIELDVRHREAVSQIFDELERDNSLPDILVNNVAGLTPIRFENTIDANLDHDVDLTLGVPMRLSRHVLPAMIKRGFGVILNVASVNGLGGYGNEAYSAAKAGLIGFTRSLAVEYGDRGIRCNAVAPGSIRTAAWDARIAADPTVVDDARRWYPLGRLGTPTDVAAALLFLASDAAAWITGVCLPIDGGLTAGDRQLARRIGTDIAD